MLIYFLSTYLFIDPLNSKKCWFDISRNSSWGCFEFVKDWVKELLMKVSLLNVVSSLFFACINFTFKRGWSRALQCRQKDLTFNEKVFPRETWNKISRLCPCTWNFIFLLPSGEEREVLASRRKVEINFQHRPCSHVFNVLNDIEKSTMHLYLFAWRRSYSRIRENKSNRKEIVSSLVISIFLWAFERFVIASIRFPFCTLNILLLFRENQPQIVFANNFYFFFINASRLERKAKWKVFVRCRKEFNLFR